MSITICAVDAGKSDTKTSVIRDGQLSHNAFPTAIGRATDGGTDLLDHVHTFSCKNLGDICREVKIGSAELPTKSDDNYSKDSDINRICTMYGIASSVNPGETVNVAIGCPLSLFKDKEKRTEYGMHVVPTGRMECVIDGEPKVFTIDKRIVYAESTGILTLHPELFSESRYDAAIVDLGGLNMNISAINNGSVIVGESNTSNHGGRFLQAEIQKRLIGEGIPITDAQVVPAIERGYVNDHDPERKKMSEEIIAEGINAFIDKVTAMLKKTWTNFDTLELFFIGGTSYLLKPYLEKRFEGYSHFEESFEAARFANADGFARKMYAKLAG